MISTAPLRQDDLGGLVEQIEQDERYRIFTSGSGALGMILSLVIFDASSKQLAATIEVGPDGVVRRITMHHPTRRSATFSELRGLLAGSLAAA